VTSRVRAAEDAPGVWALVRPLVGLAIFIAGYALLPVRTASSVVAAVTALVVLLLLVVLLFGRQARRILRSPWPGFAAAEAIVLVGAAYVLSFALLYVVLAAGSPDAFSEPLDKLDGIYFTVTVLTTVGFGDIAPVETLARALVTLQMVANLAFLAVAGRLLFGLARRARELREAGPGPG
jgi:hypothetical protein